MHNGNNEMLGRKFTLNMFSIKSIHKHTYMYCHNLPFIVNSCKQIPTSIMI